MQFRNNVCSFGNLETFDFGLAWLWPGRFWAQERNCFQWNQVKIQAFEWFSKLIKTCDGLTDHFANCFMQIKFAASWHMSTPCYHDITRQLTMIHTVFTSKVSTFPDHRGKTTAKLASTPGPSSMIAECSHVQPLFCLFAHCVSSSDCSVPCLLHLQPRCASSCPTGNLEAGRPVLDFMRGKRVNG